MTNGDFIRSMSDEDIKENFSQLICRFIQSKQLHRCQSREHCFHCIHDWLQEESEVLSRTQEEGKKFF